MNTLRAGVVWSCTAYGPGLLVQADWLALDGQLYRVAEALWTVGAAANGWHVIQSICTRIVDIDAAIALTNC